MLTNAVSSIDDAVVETMDMLPILGLKLPIDFLGRASQEQGQQHSLERLFAPRIVDTTKEKP